MVKATFLNLPPVKQALIQQALLTEFSTHPLAQAQVARIVQDAGIARGAFYKYFTDLTDAYQYLYQLAMAEVHIPFQQVPTYQPQLFYELVIKFIDQTQASKYSRLVQMHVLYNESLVARPFPSSMLAQLSAQNWNAMVLSHATIRMIFEDQAQSKVILHQFKAGLELLARGAE